MKESRISPRYASTLKASFKSEKGIAHGYVCNLSSGGFYLVTETLLEVGRHFLIEIDLPQNKGWIKGRCVVSWINDVKPKNLPEWVYRSKMLENISPQQLFKGIGVKFAEISQQQQEQLQEYLHTLSEE